MISALLLLFCSHIFTISFCRCVLPFPQHHHFPPLTLTLAFPHSPLTPSLAYCSDLPSLSVRKAKAGRQGMRFVFLRTPPRIISLLPPLALLLVAWQVQHTVEINHFPRQMHVRVCMCVHEPVRRVRASSWWWWVFCCEHGPRTTTLFLSVCMCVLLMPLAVTCPHCYHCDLCSPPPHWALSFSPSSVSFRHFAFFSALCLGCFWFCWCVCVSWWVMYWKWVLKLVDLNW